MTVMTDTIIRQVSEQVERAMEAANSARPLPHFDYVPTTGCEPSHRQDRVSSPRQIERERETSRSNCSGRSHTKQYYRHVTARSSGRPIPGETAKSTTTSTPYATHSRRTAWLDEQEQTSKPRGETSGRRRGHTTTECRNLKKALHKLADKGQIDRFLKRGSRFLRQEQESAQPQPRDGECLTEVVATIAGGYAEGTCITVPTMVFGGKEAPRFASPHNEPLVVEMKIASAIVRSVNIITWDCLKKLTYPGCDIIPLMHPILGFGG
ncbi:hypothetical protein Cgig2_014984 [Carnegiea gigantea]|uniref:Uncharacterized protein n=1 Tax=Carnegiea gigantea TaxID=171969 RepID=A0A9Q1JWH4_9CARY|nr:hypothetical protein Cgig2_014984 [Carnegiea gigantea]